MYLPSYTAAADSKSYVIISKLPPDIYKKCVENVNTLPVTGFIFVIISIVHLAGGKITEGTVYSLGCFFFFIFFQAFFVKQSALSITFWVYELILWSLYIYSGIWVLDNLSFHLLHLKFNCVRLQSMKKILSFYMFTLNWFMEQYWVD